MQKVMIENRDKLIEDLNERKNHYKTKAEEQRQQLIKQEEIKKNIKELISNYEVNNTNIYSLVRDIKKELDASGKHFQFKINKLYKFIHELIIYFFN